MSISSRLPGIERWQLDPPQSVRAAANGNPLRCLGEIATNIEIGHVVKHNVHLLVIQNLNVPGILGMDTLQKFGSFGIDWTNLRLTLGDAKLLLDKRCRGSVLSPVVVSHIFTDKMAQLDILLGAGVVTAGPQNRIPVTVMNNGEHPVKLFAGTRTGAFSPIKVEEEQPDVNAVTANPPPPPAVPKRGAAAVSLDSCEMTASEKQELKQLLDEYRDVFANNDSKVGRTHRTQFRIHTSTQVPVAVKLRRSPFSLRSEVDQQIKNMEQRDIIEPSSSPYSAPILLVPKTDGSYRFCADFRALNDATIRCFLCLLFVNAWILFMAPIFSLPVHWLLADPQC